MIVRFIAKEAGLQEGLVGSIRRLVVEEVRKTVKNVSAR